jgi:hypothetical protein
MGFSYLCYRNCDDWLFNHDQVTYNLSFLKATPNKIAGYNWFKQGVHDNLALNELYMQVNVLDKVNFPAWADDIRARVHSQCESAVADRVFGLIPRDQFFRLWEREDGRGVGNTTNIPGPNNRYFNERWQLLGHHNQIDKRRAYKGIRSRIPYHEELEKMENFKKWLAGPC